MNWIDSTIAFFSPKAGLERARQRVALDRIRGYEAAQRNKANKGWQPIDNKATDRAELEIIRKRSKDLYKNTPYAKRAVKSTRNNSIGVGILPAISDDKIKKVWDEWADDVKCDFDENNTFYGLQGFIEQTRLIQGSVFILRIRTNAKNGVPLELKVLPVTYLDKTKDTHGFKDGSRIINGIEFYKGKLKGYWLYDHDPEEPTGILTSTFWKKSDVIHYFDVEEPGQIIGVPIGVQSFQALKDFSSFTEAEIRKQLIAACFAAFVTNPNGEDEDDASLEMFERMEPGMIQFLEPGREVSFGSPPTIDNYDRFAKINLTGTAAGYDVTYEAMSSDLSNVNFSSGRMGRIEQKGNILHIQWNLMIPRVCQVVWVWFVEAAILSGKLQNTVERRIKWTAPIMEMVDASKETKAIIDQIRAGLISWQEGVRQLGYSPEEILKEMAEAKAHFDKLGVKPYSDPRFDVSRKEDIETDKEDDTDKD